MPMPHQSEFRLIVDDLLLEIAFKGKILLEEDNDSPEKTKYWKLKKLK